MSTIVLPDTPLPATALNPQFLLLYGVRKVGKSTLLSKLPNNLIIDLENGTNFLSCLKVKASNLEDFILLTEEIKKHNPRKYRYVTIDTVDILERWAFELAVKNYKASPIGKNFQGDDVSELPNMGGWNWIRKAFKEVLQYTYALAETVIYVGHVRDKFIEGVGTTATSKELDLTGRNKVILTEICDSVGHVYRDMQGIGINFVSTQHVLCSSRVSHVTGKDFRFDGKKGWEQIFLHSTT